MAGGRTCRRALRAASTAGRRERGASDAARGGAGGAPSASCLTPAGGSELGAVSGQGAAELRWWLARAGRHRAGHTLPAMLASYLLGSERHMEGLGHESGVGEWVLLGEGFRRNVHDSSECVGQERVAGMLPTLRCAPHGVLQRRRRWPRCPAPSASTCAPTRAWAYVGRSTFHASVMLPSGEPVSSKLQQEGEPRAVASTQPGAQPTAEDKQTIADLHETEGLPTGACGFPACRQLRRRCRRHCSACWRALIPACLLPLQAGPAPWAPTWAPPGRAS